MGGADPVGGGGMAGDGVGGTPGVAGGGNPGGCENLAGVQGHPDCTLTYPTHEGFTLALAEEFAQPMDLDTDPIWTWSDGALDEGLVRFTKSGISFQDGMMRITVTEEPQTGGFSHAEEKMVSDKPLTSGEMRTRYQNYRYGRYEARWRTPSVVPNDPNALGGYASTLFLFRNPKFTEWREIDIELTGDAAQQVTFNLVYGDDRGGWSADIQEFGPIAVDFNTRADFHVYGFEVTPMAVRWYADGVVLREKLAADGGLPIPNLSMKIMMSIWMGAFGGDPTPNQYPLFADYDWVRFYKWNEEDTYPCTPPAGMDFSACLDAGDLDGAKNNPDDGVPDIDPAN